MKIIFLNMKKKVFLIFLMSILVLFCSDSSQISYGIRVFPKNLDPSFGLSFDESQIASQIYENLITLDNDCITLNPCLATKWTLSKDKCTYTFFLRKNVYFHDGTLLTSRSVIKTYEWLKDRPGKSEIYDHIINVKAIDSLTFQFLLYNPYSIFLYVLASPESFQIISEKAIDRFGIAVGQKPVGTGPFYMYEWIDGKEIILRKFEKYWGKLSLIDKIKFKYYKSIFQGEEELENNIIDILYLASSYSVDRLKWTGYINYYKFPITNFFSLVLIIKCILLMIDEFEGQY